METIDCVVIGAGVVGLACARALAQAGREVIILERETTFGSGISARNSEVIHAGLYYTPGSLKAGLCVSGRDMLYRYCAERGIGHQRCGKLLVAPQPQQADALKNIHARAQTNGVHDLRWLDSSEIRNMEPELDAHAALLSPSTGIVDSHGLMLALLGDAEHRGAMLALASPVRSGRVDGDSIVLQIIDDSGTETELRARCVINAAGLDAIDIAHRIEGVPAASLPQTHFARGVYFTYRGRAPFSRLIYPIPEAGGLGVHLTLDLGGQAKFGPDVEWIDAPDYGVDPARVERFYTAIRKWWPALEDGRLDPGYAGVRPKIVGPGEPDSTAFRGSSSCSESNHPG